MVERPQAARDEAVHAPHPPLRDYYAGEAERKGWVRGIFDRTAGDYDRVERAMAFGSGSWYRRRMLESAGLERGMYALDVAAGTGLVTREAIAIVGEPSRVVALDPSIGMLREARAQLPMPAVQAAGERLPFLEGRFDFLSMGFALRHVADVEVVFREFFRVLRPGGRVCLLEITRPDGRVATTLLKAYMKGVVPVIARLLGRHAETPLLMRYYWDTIQACVPPERVVTALRHVGFEDVERDVELKIFSAYRGTKPG